MDPHIPTKTLKAVETHCSLLFLLLLFLLFFHLRSLALLSSAMATQEMNGDKENPDGRKMEEGVEPAEKDKGRFSEAFCNQRRGGGW